MNNQSVKQCSRCKETKPLSDFSKNITTSDGFEHTCKSCIKHRSREYRAKNRAKNLIRRKAAESNQIISIQQHKISRQAINTVNARDLHKFLESKKDYSSWIKARIKKYAFIEKEDFIIITQMGDNYKRGPKFKNYHLTIDMAKELSMVERTEKGRQARRYFIECEKIAKEKAAAKQLPDPDPDQRYIDAKRIDEIKNATETALRENLEWLKEKLEMTQELLKLTEANIELYRNENAWLKDELSAQESGRRRFEL